MGVPRVRHRLEQAWETLILQIVSDEQEDKGLFRQLKISPCRSSTTLPRLRCKARAIHGVVHYRNFAIPSVTLSEFVSGPARDGRKRDVVPPVNPALEPRDQPVVKTPMEDAEPRDRRVSAENQLRLHPLSERGIHDVDVHGVSVKAVDARRVEHVVPHTPDSGIPPPQQ